jgi:hypothetical protein
MDPYLISLITAAVGALVGYLGPKIAARTENKVDDAIVAYVKANLPWIEAQIRAALTKYGTGAATLTDDATRPQKRDHRE